MTFDSPTDEPWPSARSYAWVIVWRVYESCPLACQFCGFSRELFGPRPSANPVEIERFGRVLADVQQHVGRPILVSWLGGEPLLWEPLADLSCRFARQFQLHLSVTTSGLPLAYRLIRDELRNHYTQLTVSVDGLEDAHDSVRQCPGLFASIERSLRSFRQEDPTNRIWRRVNTILMRGNIHRFAELCERVADWKFHELTFNALGGNERPAFFQQHRLLPEQIAEFTTELPELRRRFRQRGLEIRGSSHYLHRLAASARNDRLAVDDCQPGQQFLFIDTQGRISPCSFTSREYGVTMSDVRSTDAFFALAQRYRAARDEHRSHACQDCHATQLFEKFE